MAVDADRPGISAERPQRATHVTFPPTTSPKPQLYSLMFANKQIRQEFEQKVITIFNQKEKELESASVLLKKGFYHVFRNECPL